jgi:hypothetical protein
MFDGICKVFVAQGKTAGGGGAVESEGVGITVVGMMMILTGLVLLLLLWRFLAGEGSSGQDMSSGLNT